MLETLMGVLQIPAQEGWSQVSIDDSELEMDAWFVALSGGGDEDTGGDQGGTKDDGDTNWMPDNNNTFEELLVSELDSMNFPRQNQLLSDEQSPTKSVGRGKNCDNILTAHTVQNVPLPNVRKAREGGAIEQCQAQSKYFSVFDMCGYKNTKKDNILCVDRAVDISTVDLCTVTKLDNHAANQMVRVGVAENVTLTGEARDHVGGQAGDAQEQLQDGDDGEQSGGREGRGAQGDGQDQHHREIENVIPVDVTCHQGGEEEGGEADGERVGDGEGAAKAGIRRVQWKVPKRRRGVIPDGMVQSRLNNFVGQFPNLGVRGGGEKVKIASGGKKRLRESGKLSGNQETMDSGGSPAKVFKYHRLPGI